MRCDPIRVAVVELVDHFLVVRAVFLIGFTNIVETSLLKKRSNCSVELDVLPQIQFAVSIVIRLCESIIMRLVPSLLVVGPGLKLSVMIL